MATVKKKKPVRTGRRSEHTKALDASEDQMAAAFEALIDEDALAWWETYGMIKLKTGELIRPEGNYLQRQIAEVMTWCRENKRACRILILKPRQKGSSTFSTAALYHDSCLRPVNSMIIGDTYSQSENLMRILGRYADHDEHFREKSPVTVKEAFARWKNGSLCSIGTAQNGEVGRSGTYQFVLGTEVARWAEAGVANAAEVLAGLVKCVGNVPGTTIILESTARGASGDFYERWKTAITFDEFKAGRDGYVKIFAPWFAFEDSIKDPATEGINGYDDLDTDEKDYMERWDLNVPQMAWRRWAIREECKRDPEQFEQDYPTTAESAFLMSGRRRFNAKGLKRMRELTTVKEPDHVMLETSREELVSARTVASAYDATCWVWERPRVGMRYLVSVDNAKGSSQTSSMDPDHHGVLVIRQGYYSSEKWYPPAVVARLATMTPKGPECRWDVDVLEYEVFKLSRYYGNCLVVPEENMDNGLIELLKRRGVPLYRREVFNRMEGKRTEQLGWRTTQETRGVLVEAVASVVREWDTVGSGIELWCPWLVNELENFILKPNGRVEAGDGYHDDQVMSLGIGLATLAQATLYTVRRQERGKPLDLIMLDMERAGQGGKRGYR